MITLYDFHAMNINDKMEAVYLGNYIGDRLEASTVIQLYNMGNFYAEVFYHREKNEIIKIRGFKTTKLIEPYVKDIKITF
ncbi:hypothetical protein ACFQZI_20005 [Mucilaginibacter lutimaris]|uniref:Phage protein n=1 Tax=Mucilaginibacter lutimaris TaxID=931629 RepID=A0ABW2ZLR7_9SPHI